MQNLEEYLEIYKSKMVLKIFENLWKCERKSQKSLKNLRRLWNPKFSYTSFGMISILEKTIRETFWFSQENQHHILLLDFNFVYLNKNRRKQLLIGERGLLFLKQQRTVGIFHIQRVVRELWLFWEIPSSFWSIPTEEILRIIIKCQFSDT